MNDTLIIYALNVNGEVMYGECIADDYSRVKADAEGRGFVIDVIEEAYGDYIKCPVSKDIVLASRLY